MSNNPTTRKKPPLSLPHLPPNPTNPNHLDLPTDLRDALTTRLFTTPTSIPAIQSALSTSLASSGWMTQLQDYIFAVLRAEPGIGEREVFERVLTSVRAGFAGTDADVVATANGGSTVERDGDAGRTGDHLVPAVPVAVVKDGVKAVKTELEKKCIYVDDEDDWNK